MKIRLLIVSVLIIIAGYSSGHSQPQSASLGSGQPITLSEFRTQMSITAIREDVARYVGEINRRGIAFLPTKELKDSYKGKVSDEILDELGKHVSFYLQISEFECRNCRRGPMDGKVFSEHLLDRVKELTQKQSLEDGSNPLFKQAIAALGPIKGLEQIDTGHVYLVLTGNLTKKGSKQTVEVWLSYIDAGYKGQTVLKTTAWDIDKPANRGEVERKATAWVATSLRPVITQTN